MKEFPRFTESIIQLELKQPHCKIIFVALQALINQLEAWPTARSAVKNAWALN